MNPFTEGLFFRRNYKFVSYNVNLFFFSNINTNFDDNGIEIIRERFLPFLWRENLEITESQTFLILSNECNSAILFFLISYF